jgi:tRNA(Met) C34 N-acetyltransferase TmcA
MATQRRKVNHTKRKTVDTAARMRAIRCLELKSQGWTESEIAVAVGYASSSGVHAALARELERHSELATHHHRRLMSHQLEQVLKRLNEYADRAKDYEEYLWISDRIAARVADLGKLWNLNLTKDDQAAAVPYVKHILLHHVTEDGSPMLPGPGETYDEG